MISIQDVLVFSYNLTVLLQAKPLSHWCGGLSAIQKWLQEPMPFNHHTSLNQIHVYHHHIYIRIYIYIYIYVYIYYPHIASIKILSGWWFQTPETALLLGNGDHHLISMVEHKQMVETTNRIPCHINPKPKYGWSSFPNDEETVD
jgi:hypothetical protein